MNRDLKWCHKCKKRLAYPAGKLCLICMAEVLDDGNEGDKKLDEKR